MVGRELLERKSQGGLWLQHHFLSCLGCIVFIFGAVDFPFFVTTQQNISKFWFFFLSKDSQVFVLSEVEVSL